MTYRRQIRVEFNHCDPAGIVFYPRYYEMTNAVIENFFRDVVERPFETLIPGGGGVPTVRVETVFRAPSRLGEMLDWALEVDRVGGSSVDLRLDCTCGGQPRLAARITLVHIAGGRPVRWPDAMRQKLETA